MNTCFRRFVLATGIVLTLSGCGVKETREALQKAQTLEDQKQYQEANGVIVDALKAREAKIRAGIPAPTDTASTEAFVKKVQSDPEILKMERAQILIYLRVERADLASAVYDDILGGNPGDTVVVDALKDRDPLIRTGAVRVLGLIGKSDSIAALAAATQDEDKDVRRAAVTALGSIKDPATVDPLIAALKDSYWFVRSEAATALGHEGDSRAIVPLLHAVEDADGTVEGSAEESLLKMAPTTPEGYIEEYANRLNSPNPKVVMISACCLAVLKDPRAVPVLLQLLSSTVPATRLQAIKALCLAGDPSVIPVFRQALGDPDTQMRIWGIMGLYNLKDTDSLPVLRAMAADPAQPSDVRNAAQTTIDRMTGQAAPPSEP